MAIRRYKPTTPSLRWIARSDFKEITKTHPEKSLVVTKKSSGGRNSNGRITVRHRGGGAKRKIRIVDFKRDRFDIPAKVFAIEYDPNRTSRIALLKYSDGEKRYIIAPVGLKVGDEVVSGMNVEIKTGNATVLRNIPPGTPIHNLEMKEGKGAQLARTAGAGAIIMAKEEPYAHVKLPSGEVRLLKLGCMATIGQVGNVEHDTEMIGKAGRSRHMGRRPRVRGVAMNPHDHPLGGGEGKSSGGRHPTTPWGKPTKGFKTRKARPSDKYILKRRK